MTDRTEFEAIITGTRHPTGPAAEPDRQIQPGVGDHLEHEHEPAERRYPPRRPGWLGTSQLWPCGRCGREVDDESQHVCTPATGPGPQITDGDMIVANVHALSGHLDACLDGIGRTDVHSLDWLREYQQHAGQDPDVADMRARWTAEALGEDPEEGAAWQAARALMDCWPDEHGQAVRIHADPRTVVQVVLTALAAQYKQGAPS